MVKDRTGVIQEVPIFEDDSDEEGIHASEVREEENEQDGDISNEDSSPRSPRRRGLRYKWLIFLLVGILLIGSGYVVLHRMGWDVLAIRIPLSEPLKVTDQDHLQENTLSPFFIPLPPDSSNRVLVIDFSVVWDGLASVRFEKKKLLIRNKLYSRILKLAQRKKNLHEKGTYLEREISRIFRKSLGRDDLTVRIKTIKAY